MKYDRDQVEKSIADVVEMFTSKSFPQEIERTIIRRMSGEADRPSDKWSLRNQMIMRYIGKTDDARGFKQWQEAERSVKKGAKAFYIQGPIFKKKEVENAKGELEEQLVLVGFSMIPVFAAQDTEGKDLPVFDYTPKNLPPLHDIAKKFGFTVHYSPAIGSILGKATAAGLIELHSEDADVFFHELAHQVNGLVEGDFWHNPNNTKRAEICAELASVVLCKMYGFDGYVKQGYDYIKGYAPNDVMKEVGAVLDTVNAIVTKIVGKEGE